MSTTHIPTDITGAEMTLRQFTAHMRNRIKVAGIKAHVRGQVICGDERVYVSSVAYDIAFTEDEQRTIRSIAVANGCTLVQGMPIVIEQMTNPHDFFFYRP